MASTPAVRQSTPVPPANHSAERPFQCTLCDNRFKLKKHLTQHSKNIHTENKFEGKKLHQATVHSQERKFRSDECDAMIANCYVSLRKLQVEDANLKELACPKNSSTTVNKLKTHVNTHSTDTLLESVSRDRTYKYKCVLCTKSYKHSGSLFAHKQRAHSEQRFYCKICEHSSGTAADMRIHTARHSTEQPFQCEICSRGFKSKRYLLDHQTTLHSYERKTFSCDECGATFGHRKNLTSHRLKHKNLKEFQCLQCPKQFFTAAKLKLHVVTHNPAKPLKCENCSKQFRTKKGLWAHNKRNHYILGI